MVRESHRKASFLRVIWCHCIICHSEVSLEAMAYQLFLQKYKVIIIIFQNSSNFMNTTNFQSLRLLPSVQILVDKISIKSFWARCMLNSWCMWSAALLSLLIICFIIAMHIATLRYEKWIFLCISIWLALENEIHLFFFSGCSFAELVPH